MKTHLIGAKLLHADELTDVSFFTALRMHLKLHTIHRQANLTKTILEQGSVLPRYA
jgi:hypothetical protein